MDQIGMLERLFRYKATANEETLAAMRQFDDASPAKEVAIRIMSHTYVVDRIFAANLTGTERGYNSANTSRAPSLDELSEAIKISDRWYLDYVSGLDEAQLAERIDFTFTDGDPGQMSREEILMHVMLHGGAHRGQVGWIMMQNSITPPADRFTSHLHKAEASTRRRPASTSTDRVESHSAGMRPNTTPDAGQHPSKTAANERSAMSPLDQLTESIKSAVAANSALGKTLKFDLKGEGFIHIEGASVTNEDRPADLTLTIGIDDLKAIGQGKLAPMTAVIGGRLGLSDMDVAMGLQGEMQSLFARMKSAS